jgi:hypothetical protein
MQELLHLVIRPISQVFLQGLGCETNIRAVRTIPYTKVERLISHADNLTKDRHFSLNSE